MGFLKSLFSAIGGVFSWLREGRLKQAGRDAEKVKASEKVIDNVKKANEAKRDLNDPSERKRVRKKYSRD